MDYSSVHEFCGVISGDGRSVFTAIDTDTGFTVDLRRPVEIYKVSGNCIIFLSAAVVQLPSCCCSYITASTLTALLVIIAVCFAQPGQSVRFWLYRINLCTYAWIAGAKTQSNREKSSKAAEQQAQPVSIKKSQQILTDIAATNVDSAGSAIAVIASVAAINPTTTVTVGNESYQSQQQQLSQQRSSLHQFQPPNALACSSHRILGLLTVDHNQLLWTSHYTEQKPGEAMTIVVVGIVAVINIAAAAAAASFMSIYCLMLPLTKKKICYVDVVTPVLQIVRTGCSCFWDLAAISIYVGD